MKILDTHFDETDIFDQYVIGSMGNYLSPKEFKSLVNEILRDFPEITKKVNVGMTFNMLEMPGIVFALGVSGE